MCLDELVILDFQMDSYKISVHVTDNVYRAKTFTWSGKCKGKERKFKVIWDKV